MKHLYLIFLKFNKFKHFIFALKPPFDRGLYAFSNSGKIYPLSYLFDKRY